MYYSKFNSYIRERVLLYFNSMKVDKKEDKMPVQVSISVLVIAVAVSVMVTFYWHCFGTVMWYKIYAEKIKENKF